PDPRPALLDLRARPPAEPLRVAPQRVDPELLVVRARARGHEHVQVVERRRAEPRPRRGGRLVELVDRLVRTGLARARHLPPRALPQLGDGALLADDHSGAPARGRVRERVAPAARRDDVRADVTERGEAAVLGLDGAEAPEPAPGDVLQED